MRSISSDELDGAAGFDRVLPGTVIGLGGKC